MKDYTQSTADSTGAGNHIADSTGAGNQRYTSDVCLCGGEGERGGVCGGRGGGGISLSL